jgi:putative tryptophan/tyrosine transport system substrate-binding protein
MKLLKVYFIPGKYLSRIKSLFTLLGYEFHLSFIFYISFFCFISQASCFEIAVIKSSKSIVYDKAVQGFMSEDLKGHVLCEKTISSGIKYSHYIAGSSPCQDFIRKIKETPPGLILAIGKKSLSEVKDISIVPIIYLLVSSPEQLTAGKTNIFGVEMKISAAQQLIALTRAIPKVKRVGIIFDPKRTGNFAKEAQVFSDLKRIELVTHEIKRPQEVASALTRMANKIDAFWMVPDLTVLTPETIEMIMLFSLENKVPVLTFANKYLKKGATISVSFDLHAMGKQAGKMAKQILEGKNNMPKLAETPIDTHMLSINKKIAKKLGIIPNMVAAREFSHR